MSLLNLDLQLEQSNDFFDLESPAVCYSVARFGLSAARALQAPLQVVTDTLGSATVTSSSKLVSDRPTGFRIGLQGCNVFVCSST